MDGVKWHYPYINGSAYWENATMQDGSTWHFQQRERPHLVLGKDGVTPVALTNGAAVDGSGLYNDHTWTFIQPLATPTDRGSDGDGV
jgi:hypothetical protein